MDTITRTVLKVAVQVSCPSVVGIESEVGKEGSVLESVAPVWVCLMMYMLVRLVF